MLATVRVNIIMCYMIECVNVAGGGGGGGVDQLRICATEFGHTVFPSRSIQY